MQVVHLIPTPPRPTPNPQLVVSTLISARLKHTRVSPVIGLAPREVSNPAEFLSGSVVAELPQEEVALLHDFLSDVPIDKLVEQGSKHFFEVPEVNPFTEINAINPSVAARSSR